MADRPRRAPTPRLPTTFDDWVRSLDPPDCPHGHGPMRFDHGLVDEIAYPCGCEAEGGAFVCPSCSGPELVEVRRVTWREPRCRLSVSEHT